MRKLASWNPNPLEMFMNAINRSTYRHMDAYICGHTFRHVSTDRDTHTDLDRPTDMSVNLPIKSQSI
jgi:hypothetical protein